MRERVFTDGWRTSSDCEELQSAVQRSATTVWSSYHSFTTKAGRLEPSQASIWLRKHFVFFCFFINRVKETQLEWWWSVKTSEATTWATLVFRFRQSRSTAKWKKKSVFHRKKCLQCDFVILYYKHAAQCRCCSIRESLLSSSHDIVIHDQLSFSLSHSFSFVSLPEVSCSTLLPVSV